MPLAVDAQVGLLDELLLRLTHGPQSTESEIAQKHFQEARVYLLCAAYDEYVFSLKLGRWAIHAMHDRNIRAELSHLVSRLIDRSDHGTLRQPDHFVPRI